jgi:transcription antitermination factor NusG
VLISHVLKILFEIGEVVRIIDGPFKDFNGEVEEVIYEKVNYVLRY